MLIEGLFVPLTTPFDRDGKLYLAKLKTNVRRYSLAPIAGMVALTSTGEGVTLSDREVADVLRAVSEAASAEKVLIASVHGGDVEQTLERIALAEACGFDVALVQAPAGEMEVESLLSAVAEASALPILLGSTAKRPIRVATVKELTAQTNVLGLVDERLGMDRLQAVRAATREVQRISTVTTVFAPVTRRMQARDAIGSLLSADTLVGGLGKAAMAEAPLKTRMKTTGFAVIGCAADGLLATLEAGAAGAVLPLAACAPQACFEVYAAFKDGDPALAAVKQQRVVQAEALLRKLGIAGVKYGCDRNAYYGGAPRLPHLPLLGVEREEMDAVFAGIPS